MVQQKKLNKFSDDKEQSAIRITVNISLFLIILFES